jgi:hypothetical protein
MRPVLLKAKTANMVGGLKLQFAFLCGDNIWTVVLRQMKFDAVKDHERAYKFYLNLFLWRSFWVWRWWEFCGYIGTNAQPLSVEFYNFVQYYTFLL